ncbi:unnamed protein product [Mytilus edulis]|uniref:Uncharacterized protein n=1 Tax=Mytilus edulis TaxID=6550 RepID=A0A8S3UFB9_MYTED|nr:unnamed protein product [Mytilus edulis]
MHRSYLGTGLENDHHGIFLNDLKSLQHIDFAKNEFKWPFSNITFQSQLQSLRFLILEGNMFTIMPIYLAGFNQLSFLDIRNNKILYLTNKETNDIERAYTKLKGPLAILLEGNPFVCNCDSLNFVKWLFNTRVKLDRHGNYSCLLYGGSFTTTYQVYKMKQDVENHCFTTSHRGDQIIKDKYGKKYELNKEIRKMEKDYKRILDDTLNKLIDKLEEQKDKWEKKATILQTENVNNLREFGLTDQWTFYSVKPMRSTVDQLKYSN